MARSRLKLSEFRSKVYRYLRESDVSGESFWSHAQLLDALNDERDLLKVYLSNHFEGYSVETVTANLVANQSHYSFPTDQGRVLTVSRKFSDGRVVPLERNEKWHTPSAGTTGAVFEGEGYVPTYKQKGQYIVLSPAPTSAVSDGLQIDYEVALDLLSDDNDLVTPPDQPIEAETYLLFAVLVNLLDQEGAQGPQAEGVYQSFLIKKNEWLVRVMETYETRSFGLVQNSTLYLMDGWLLPFLVGTVGLASYMLPTLLI